MDLGGIKEQTRAIHAGKKWILAVDVAAAATRMAERLIDEGAAGVMVVAGMRGVGDLPTNAEIFYTNTSGPTLMRGIRAYVDSVEQPSIELLEAVDSFDPDREAMVLGAGFSREPELCGRPIYGIRRREWRALEDKTLVDELWDRAGIARAPSELVPVADAPAAAARLHTQLGTVWAADNREGWHGGGEYTRWLRTPAEEAAAVEWFDERADRVRVMPFLDGIPCSVHGFVTDDGVAVFLPLELFILRPHDSDEFFYAQGANYWTPPGWVEDGMRDAARRVGALLKAEFAYRGGFGIDGVATSEGFLPNELNPRLTLGHAIQSRTADVNLGDIERAVLEGTLELPAQWLEDTIVDVVRTRRGGGAMVFIFAEHESDTTWLRLTDDGVGQASEEDHDITVSLGPAAFGSAAIVNIEEGAVEPGPSFAPRVVQVIDHIRELWDLEIPTMESAPDVLAVD